MNKIAIINCGDNGSTGKICTSLMQYYSSNNFDVLFACHNVKEDLLNDNRVYQIKENKIAFFLNKVLCRLDGSDGFRNKAATKKLIKKLDVFSPGIVHLHNLHGHYINIELLLNFLFKKNIKIIWTLHDCWAFTGRCPYFDITKCSQWKNGCNKCPKQALHDYPAAYLFNRPRYYFNKKNELFSKFKKNLLFVTPSNWLFNLLGSSILKEFNRAVINNGINNAVTSIQYDSIKLNCDYNKIILICVAYPFSKTKGIDHVIKLSKCLDYSKFELIVVGLKEKQKCLFDKRIKSVGYISNPNTMVFLFGCADYFINPTLEDNFPTVNIESLKAGTPVITFETGGSPEVLTDKTGIVVERDNFEKMLDAIKNISKKTDFIKKECIERSMIYTEEKMCSNYLDIIQKLLEIKEPD